MDIAFTWKKLSRSDFIVSIAERLGLDPNAVLDSVRDHTESEAVYITFTFET